MPGAPQDTQLLGEPVCPVFLGNDLTQGKNGPGGRFRCSFTLSSRVPGQTGGMWDSGNLSLTIPLPACLTSFCFWCRVGLLYTTATTPSSASSRPFCHLVCACVCVCVLCMCTWERQSERESAMVSYSLCRFSDITRADSEWNLPAGI